MEAATYASQFDQVMKTWDDTRDRSRQIQIGPSEIGFCRQRTALKIRNVPQTDAKETASARIGTAVHVMLAEARSMFTHLLIETELTIKVDVPRYGVVEILGHADEIDPDEPSVTDWKTVDGFEKVKRFGTSQNHRFQRHLYAMGAIQAGLVPERGLIVRNVYIDRSGAEPGCFVLQEPYDPAITDQVVAWLDDVMYAVINNEDASRDVAAPVCEHISCEWFTACRGSLPTSEYEIITDPDLLQAVTLYVEGRSLATRGDRMKTEAKSVLNGLNGSTGEWQVRTIEIGPSEIPAVTRSGYSKIEVVKVRKGRP